MTAPTPSEPDYTVWEFIDYQPAITDLLPNRLLPFLHPSGVLFDVGGNTGGVALFLAERGHTCTGIDINVDGIAACLQRARLRLAARDVPASAVEFFGESTAMREVMTQLRQAAKHAASTVLLTGETGAGKDLAARALHQLTYADANAPFIAVNCAALPAEMFESELFGAERGAYTGADKSARASWRRRMKPCSSTKSPKSRWRCRGNCCGCWTHASFARSAARSINHPLDGSWPRRTRRWPTR